MSLVARSNMRWVQGPLWDILFGSATSAQLSVCTHTGRERQKSLTQNKGIIIPYREKWSLHFPARFRSLIQTRHNGWHLGKGVVYSKLDTFLPIALFCTGVFLGVCSFLLIFSSQPLIVENSHELGAGFWLYHRGKNAISGSIFLHFELFLQRANCPVKLRALIFIDPTGLDVALFALDGNGDME